MIKTIPTIPKLLAMILFALGSFGALLFLWLSFGGPVPFHPKGYQFEVDFPEAGQLTEQADVRISGVNVGKVLKVRPDANGPTKATIEIKPRYAPIPRATKATLRSKTLLGETYVELAPNRSAKSPALKENASLPVSAVAPTVELDELLRAFDKPTREAFRVWMQSQAGAFDGRGSDINATFAAFPDFVEQFDKLSATLDTQSAAVRQSVSSTAAVFNALSERQGDLRGLVQEGNKTFSTIGQRNKDLAAIFQKLPRFERESTKTLPKITELADKADPTVVRMQSVATELTPTFDAVKRLSPDLERFMNRAGPVITASAQGLPAFNRILGQLPPLLKDFGPFTRTVNPLLRYLAQHKSDITAFFGNVTAATQQRQAIPGGSSAHYIRLGANLSPQGLAYQGRPFGQNRTNPYVAPGGANDLPQGLKTLIPGACDNGDPAPPQAPSTAGLTELLPSYVFRTAGRDSARPACAQQGPQPGYSTLYPQLTADPETDTEGATR